MKMRRFSTLLLMLSLSIPVCAVSSPMVMIPEGPVTLGYGAKLPYGPERRVLLKPYLIDQSEVSHEAFKQRFPKHRFRKGAAQHPVTNVSWHRAREYCEKVGGRLPTGEEWEKAARGDRGSIYPWGDRKPRKKPHPFYSGVVKKNVGSNKQDISSYGVRDMAGSVWEWTADAQGTSKVIRGGLWNLHLDFQYSKAYEKAAIPPEERLSFLGFRCVRSMD